VPNITKARRYVEVPAPAPKVGGLYAVARVINTSDPHDLLGAEYQTDACTQAEHWSDGNCGYGYPATPCNVGGTPTLKDFHGLDLVTGDPTTVYDGIDCNLLGGDTDWFESRVRAGLDLKEQYAVEKHVAGLLDSLAGAPVDTASVVAAIATAEEFLADNYAGLGVIHMGRGATTEAIAADVVVVGLDGTLTTAQGTPVANGAGYGSVTGTTVYASGQVTILRGPLDSRIAPGQDLDGGGACGPPRAIAERTVVPLIECTVAKITVTPAP
jgi:hypothetical protein